MRSIIRVLLLICCSGHLLSVFAQRTVTRSGFAVVTAVSGNVSSLTATESLRIDNRFDVAQVVVGPSPLINSGSILVNVGSGIGIPRTAIAIANPSIDSGNVNLSLTDPRGGIIMVTTVHLGPRGQVARFLNDLFPVPPEVGSPLLLKLSSSIPVAVLAFDFVGIDFASIPITTSSVPTSIPDQPNIPGSPFPPIGTIPPIGSPIPPINPIPPLGPVIPPVVTTGGIPTSPNIIGGNALVFAQVAAGGVWSTEISVGNTSDVQQFIRVDFFGSDGAIFGSFANIAIPPRGVVFVSTDSVTSVIR